MFMLHTVHGLIDLGVTACGLHVTAAVGRLNHASVVSRELAVHVDLLGRDH